LAKTVPCSLESKQPAVFGSNMSIIHSRKVLPKVRLLSYSYRVIGLLWRVFSLGGFYMENHSYIYLHLGKIFQNALQNYWTRNVQIHMKASRCNLICERMIRYDTGVSCCSFHFVFATRSTKLLGGFRWNLVQRMIVICRCAFYWGKLFLWSLYLMQTKLGISMSVYLSVVCNTLSGFFSTLLQIFHWFYVYRPKIW
jgi:hypothetical protein